MVERKSLNQNSKNLESFIAMLETMIGESVPAEQSHPNSQLVEAINLGITSKSDILVLLDGDETLMNCIPMWISFYIWFLFTYISEESLDVEYSRGSRQFRDIIGAEVFDKLHNLLQLTYPVNFNLSHLDQNELHMLQTLADLRDGQIVGSLTTRPFGEYSFAGTRDMLLELGFSEDFPIIMRDTTNYSIHETEEFKINSMEQLILATRKNVVIIDDNERLAEAVKMWNNKNPDKPKMNVVIYDNPSLRRTLKEDTENGVYVSTWQKMEETFGRIEASINSKKALEKSA